MRALLGALARRGRPRLLVVAGDHAQRLRRRAGAVAPRVARRAHRAVPRHRRAPRAPRSSSSPWSAGSREEHLELMAAMSAAANRPLNWNVLAPSAPRRDARVRAAAAPATTRPSAAARVLALTVPERHPDAPLVQVRVRARRAAGLAQADGAADRPRRWRCSPNPEERAQARRAGRTPPRPGSSPAWRRGARTRSSRPSRPRTRASPDAVVGDIAAERGQDPFDALCDIVDRATSCARCSARGRAPTTRSRGSCAATCGATSARSSVRPTPAPTSTCCRRSTSPRRCSRVRASTSSCRSRRRCATSPTCPRGSTACASAAASPRAGTPTSWCSTPTRSGPGRSSGATTCPPARGACTAGPIGVDHVLVNGTEIVQGTEVTGATPGVVFRSGRDTDTVEARP